jgi:hypothetical protein
MSDNSIAARQAVWRARAKATYKRSGGKHKKIKLNACLSNKNAKELVNNYKLSIGRCVLHEFYNDGQQYYCEANNVVAFCFDHIDRATKLAAISQMIGRATYEQLVNEIAKCWLVCANCHAIKGFENKDHLPLTKIQEQRDLLTLFDI